MVEEKKQPSYEDYLKGTGEILRESTAEKEKYYVRFIGENNDARPFVVHPGVFSPKYFLDTRFFTREIPITEGEEFLEIGCGTGVTSIFAVLRGAKHVTATDINPLAVANTRENVKLHGLEDKITVLEGDLYEPLPADSQFNTIYWNTPFGFVDKNKPLCMLERAVFDPGYETTRRFVQESKKYLKNNGRLLIGFSTTLGRFELLQEFLNNAGFSIPPRCVASEESSEVHPVSFEIFEAIPNNGVKQ